jgi:hypothetical protein
MAEKAFQQLFSNTNITNFIFIYTPPKVGSTTLVSSLRISLGNTFNVIHIHDDTMLSVLTGINNVSINDIISYIALKGYNIYVFDIYRTPLERKMSEFFEKLGPHHFNNSEEHINEYSIKRISDRFNKIFPYLANNDNYFEKFNICNPPNFDFDKKYTLQVINNIKYVKLRLNDSIHWADILSKIFEKDIVLINDYTTETKPIGELYKRFKLEYKIPSNYVDLIKTCKYFNFYLSPNERTEYIQNLENKKSASFISYTPDEYKFYVNLYLENQYINDIQVEHYIDNGCICSVCYKKRTEIFNKAKKGEHKFDKIIHTQAVNEFISNKAQIIISRLNKNKNTKYSSINFKNTHGVGVKFSQKLTLEIKR